MDSPTEIARSIGQASREIAERRHRERVADERSRVLNKIIKVTKKHASGPIPFSNGERHPPGKEVELSWEFDELMDETIAELQCFGFSVKIGSRDSSSWSHMVRWTAVVPCEEEN